MSSGNEIKNTIYSVIHIDINDKFVRKRIIKLLGCL